MNPLVLICGVDEAGRGPLAGPVVAASVIFVPGTSISGVADSKTLKPNVRTRLAEVIKQNALSWNISSASVEEIDSLNILQASLLAMKRAIYGMSLRPTSVFVDGMHCPQIELPVTAVIKGDKLIAEISAASILAKVARDEIMTSLHTRYPIYRFDRHMGYPTLMHLELLKTHGACSVHRKTFSPVRAAMAQSRGLLKINNAQNRRVRTV